jgi:ketosteroid isomerase-like protein
VELTRLFTEALNARDLDALRALVAEDVELSAASGPSLHGLKGLEAVVRAAADTDLLLVRTGPEQVDGSGETARVSVPMRVLVRKSDLGGTAQFEVRDGRIARYGVVTTGVD